MSEPFRIETKESFRVIGYKITTTNQKRQGKTAIPQHWSSLQANNQKEALLALGSQEPSGLFGINIYNTDSNDARRFEYMIGVASDHELKNGLSEYIVPSNTWAIFPCTQETIGKTEAQAITKWLPKSKYKPLNKGYITGRMKSGAPDIEHYEANGQVEVWVAVQEK